jgi:glycosyltransferase involved in cell wall biosynthesis
VIAVTSGVSQVLLRGQLAYLRKQGFDVFLSVSPNHGVERFTEAEGAALLPVPMEREISPWADLKALAQIIRHLKSTRPDVVNAGTPKAGLLVTAAAWLCRVPCRVFTLRGLRSDALTGVKQRIVWTMEWLSCRLAHRVICISPSLKQRAVYLKLCPASKAIVIGGGSSNGVNTEQFKPTPERHEQAKQWRNRLELGPDVPTIGFVGRVTRDKGVGDLLDAWQTLRQEFPGVRLLIVGPNEIGDGMKPEHAAMLRDEPDIVLTGHIDDPVPLYLLMDVLALPSYREGFGNVLLEAAAMERPTVATRVPGCMDAVADGVTGTLVDAKQWEPLAEALKRYLLDPDLRRQHGRAGRARAVSEFSQERIWSGQIQLYREMLSTIDKSKFRRR